MKTFNEYTKELSDFVKENKASAESGTTAEHIAFAYGVYCMGGTVNQCKALLESHSFDNNFKLPDQEIIDIAF